MKKIVLCPICKKTHILAPFKLDEILFCDNKVTSKLSKYKSISKKSMLKEFDLYRKIECIDCSRKVDFSQMKQCQECDELVCPNCYAANTRNILCKTCYGQTKLDKCKFCKQETDMYRQCVKCYEDICWSCITRCRSCCQIICPECAGFVRTCTTCSDEKQFYLKFKK